MGGAGRPVTPNDPESGMPQANTLDLPVGELTARLDPTHLERDVVLAPYTTFKIGGPADLLYRARTPRDLADAVTAARGKASAPEAPTTLPVNSAAWRRPAGKTKDWPPTATTS